MEAIIPSIDKVRSTSEHTSDSFPEVIPCILIPKQSTKLVKSQIPFTNITMKLLAIIAALFTTGAVLAAPQPHAEIEDRDTNAALSCFHPSHCSRNWSGNCEDYCRDYGGFSHMTGDDCGILAKRCCCDRK